MRQQPVKNTTARLGTEPIVPLVFRLAAPSIIGMAVQALYNVVDTIYVGHVSKTALSALSLAFPFQMILIAIAVVIGIIGAVINIGIDPLLIYGIGPFPELGVAGAAYATVFARLASGIFIVIVLLQGDHQIKLRLKDFKYNGQIIKEVYKVGFPAMLMQLLASFMIAGMNKIVVTFNVTAVAVVGVFFRLQPFILMPVFGLGQGYIPIVGYNFGHKNPERMKKAILYGMIIGEVFTIFGFLLFQIIPRPLMLMYFWLRKTLKEIFTSLEVMFSIRQSSSVVLNPCFKCFDFLPDFTEQFFPAGSEFFSDSLRVPPFEPGYTFFENVEAADDFRCCVRDLRPDTLDRPRRSSVLVGKCVRQ